MILEEIAALTAATVPKVDLRLVTALADGADSICAELALEMGWKLQVVLPFPSEVYATDFMAETSATYASLLQAADALFELDGTRATEEAAAAAYERAGRVVLDQTDVLIAVWDNGPALGRGGAAQIVAEAVDRGIPVIHIDPAQNSPTVILWAGLGSTSLENYSVETVPRAKLTSLAPVLSAITVAPVHNDILKGAERLRPGLPGVAYTLLLAASGVRRLQRADFAIPNTKDGTSVIDGLCTGGSLSDGGFGLRLREILSPRFAQADAVATYFARRFRSGYVLNFTLAAVAVLLSLFGLVLPAGSKLVLIVLEILTIGAILALTRIGNRAGWHRRWLDNRELAERLRCLALSSQLGQAGAVSEDADSWVGWYSRMTAREIGLPSVRVSSAYLECCRTSLLRLVEDQIDYLGADATRMHHLEHRLHLLGSMLFAITALVCVILFLFKVAGAALPGAEAFSSSLTIGATIASAALPAIGAAIYGIRMQGDFAGSAERSTAIRHQLLVLREAVAAENLEYDTLRRRIARATELLTAGVASWRQSYHARPLTLPG